MNCWPSGKYGMGSFCFNYCLNSAWRGGDQFVALLRWSGSPGFFDSGLNLCLNVCSPSQVLWDVYTEVLEAAHPLHRGPTDHKRTVGPLLSLPEVHDQLFSFTHIQREIVVLAPWCKSLYLIKVCGLITFVCVCVCVCACFLVEMVTCSYCLCWA